VRCAQAVAEQVLAAVPEQLREQLTDHLHDALLQDVRPRRRSRSMPATGSPFAPVADCLVRHSAHSNLRRLRCARPLGQRIDGHLGPSYVGVASVREGKGILFTPCGSITDHGSVFVFDHLPSECRGAAQIDLFQIDNVLREKFLLDLYSAMTSEIFSAFMPIGSPNLPADRLYVITEGTVICEVDGDFLCGPARPAHCRTAAAPPLFSVVKRLSCEGATCLLPCTKKAQRKLSRARRPAAHAAAARSYSLHPGMGFGEYGLLDENATWQTGVTL